MGKKSDECYSWHPEFYVEGQSLKFGIFIYFKHVSENVGHRKDITIHQYASALVVDAREDELDSRNILFTLADQSEESLEVNKLSVTALFAKGDQWKTIWSDAAFWLFDEQRAIKFFKDLATLNIKKLSENYPFFTEDVIKEIRSNGVQDKYTTPRVAIMPKQVKPLSSLMKAGDLSWAPDPSPDIKHSKSGNDLNLEVIDQMMVSRFTNNLSCLVFDNSTCLLSKMEDEASTMHEPFLSVGARIRVVYSGGPCIFSIFDESPLVYVLFC